MANLYGVANPVIQSGINVPVSDTTCNPGVETTVISSFPMYGLDKSGVYYPVLFWSLNFGVSATPPATLTIAFRLHNGSDIQQWPINMSNVPAASTIILNGFFTGTGAVVPWQAPGTVVELTVLATTNSILCGAFASHCMFWLQRAPDQ